MSGEKEEKGREVRVFDGIEAVKNFCYLGDIIQRDGGVKKSQLRWAGHVREEIKMRE